MKKLLALMLLVPLFAPLAASDDVEESSEFVFARVRFNMTWGALRQSEAPWHHDYPFSEHFYLSILREITSLHTRDDAYEIVDLDSSDIFKFPFLYVSEPGFMDPSDAEVDNLREYFDRGGFVMFDDFRGVDLYNLQYVLKRVYPDREMFLLNPSDEIFNVFYSIESLEMVPFYFDERFTGFPEFWGMTDEYGRLILVANQNNDLGEYWEALDLANTPLEPSTQSVRLGINYMIYAMTH